MRARVRAREGWVFACVYVRVYACARACLWLWVLARTLLVEKAGLLESGAKHSSCVIGCLADRRWDPGGLPRLCGVEVFIAVFFVNN